MSDQTTRQARVAFAGMTHLGIVSATAVASKGFRTLCYDPDRELIERLSAGELPVLEPGLEELRTVNGALQEFTADIDDIGACDVVYIAADVPTDDEGRSDLTSISALIDRIASALSPEGVLVVLCQVPPGFTRGLTSPPLARRFYQVETLVFGRAVERATGPERYIVGTSTPEEPLPAALAEVLGAFDCAILPMRYESAELAKISINVSLVASISVANTLAELCEELGADWSEIVPALKLDARIGPKSYLAPGLGIAGGNLERDLATVIELAGTHATDSGVIEAFLANSRHRRNWAAREARRELVRLPETECVAIWGLAYKENTHSIKNSPSLATIGQLHDVAIRVHDPVVKSDVVNHPDVTETADPLDALDGAEFLMILTPWADYRTCDISRIAARLKGNVVIDPYKVLNGKEACLAGLDYRTLGVNQKDGG